MPLPGAGAGDVCTVEVLREELHRQLAQLRKHVGDDIREVVLASRKQEHAGRDRTTSSVSKEMSTTSSRGKSPTGKSPTSRVASGGMLVKRTLTLEAFASEALVETQRSEDQEEEEEEPHGAENAEEQEEEQNVTEVELPAGIKVTTFQCDSQTSSADVDNKELVPAPATDGLGTATTEALELLSNASAESLFFQRHRKGYMAGRELQGNSDFAAGQQNFRRALSTTLSTIIDEEGSQVASPLSWRETVNLTMPYIVQSQYFDALSTLAILLYCVMLGVQADDLARHLYKHEFDMQAYTICEGVFCAAFTIEVLARLVAAGVWQFCTGEAFVWNLFDSAVLVVQWLEMAAELLGSVMTDHFAIDPGVGIIRVWRIVRLARVLRVLRTLRSISELRTIVVSIFGTMRTLLWTMVLLLLVIFLFAVFMTHVVAYHCVGAEQWERDLLQKHWGNLPQAILVLFQAISNGIDWEMVLDPLVTYISPWLAFPLCAYIGFGVFALMNIVTGVFVESALESAKREQERFLLHTVEQLFKDTDDDGSGEISWEEFQCKLEHPDMHVYFQSIDLDIDEAEDLFRLIDIDGSGSIDPEEFVNGCLRLQGPAKAIDLATLMHEYQRREKRDQLRHRGICNALALLVRKKGRDCQEEPKGDAHFEAPAEEHRVPLASPVTMCAQR